jgi:hypothetical protein
MLGGTEQLPEAVPVFSSSTRAQATEELWG